MPLGAAILGSAGLSAGTSLISGLIGSGASKSAAQQQELAAEQALTLQATEFNKTQSNLQPFVSQGVSANSALSGLTGTNPGGNPLTAPLTAPFQPTQAQLSATPGYQFTLGQGELAAQNSFAAQGLGTSGAAEKGAVNYAEGLASTTYQQQFQNYLSQNSQIYNMLSGQQSQGESAAAGLGSLGQQTASNEGNALTAGAAAGAAGTVGSATSLTNALGGISSAGSNAALLTALGGNTSLFSGSGTGGITDEQLNAAGGVPAANGGS